MSYRASVGRKQRRKSRPKPPRVVVRNHTITEVKPVPMDRDATIVADVGNLTFYALSCMGVEVSDLSALFHVHEYGVAERIEAGAATAKAMELNFERYKSLLRRVDEEATQA